MSGAQVALFGLLSYLAMTRPPLLRESGVATNT